MQTSVLITENFYSDPDRVREFALSQDFNVTGNYPGSRTVSFLDQGTKDAIQSVVWNAGGQVTNWYNEDGYTGSFQLTYASDRSWIHSDHTSMWAGVLYLTPNAPLSGGTATFRHKATGAMTGYQMGDRPYESQDMTKWDMVDRMANVYNRLVMYRGDTFHTSLDYFGSTPQDGRLFQLFFFDTEY
jgi:hypothetical protein